MNLSGPRDTISSESQLLDRSSRKRLQLNNSCNLVTSVANTSCEKTTSRSIMNNFGITVSSTSKEDSYRDSSPPVNGFGCAEESGIISVKSIKSVGFYFKNAPVWILGLFLMKIGTVHIPQFASFLELLNHIQSRGFDSKIYNKYVSLIGRRRFLFGKYDIKVSYLLLSGSTIF